MRTVSVGEIRQNPTAAFDAVERGETVELTRHNRPFGHIVPVSSGRPRGVRGADVMAWLATKPFESFDVQGWHDEIRADRAAEDQVPKDPWQPNQ